MCRREPVPTSYGRRGDDRRGGGGRASPADPAVPAYYDQLDGPVREAGGAVPDLQADFPTLGSQQGFAGSGGAKVGYVLLPVFRIRYLFDTDLYPAF